MINFIDHLYRKLYKWPEQGNGLFTFQGTEKTNRCSTIPHSCYCDGSSPRLLSPKGSVRSCKDSAYHGEEPVTIPQVDDEVFLVK